MPDFNGIDPFSKGHKKLDVDNKPRDNHRELPWIDLIFSGFAMILILVIVIVTLYAVDHTG